MTFSESKVLKSSFIDCAFRVRNWTALRKNLLNFKITIQRMKREVTDWETIFTNRVPNNGYIQSL